MEMGCRVVIGQLKGMGTWLLNHCIKKGNMMVVIMMIDLDQNLYSPKQQALVFFSVSIHDLIPAHLTWPDALWKYIPKLEAIGVWQYH